MIISILNVAEKPSVAKEVARILSNSKYENEYSESKFNPVYTFDYNFNGQKTKMHFTSVTGHLMGLQFKDQMKNWRIHDPQILFKQADVVKTVDSKKLDLEKNLKRQASKCSKLILWLDCDREGENIAFEVIQVCQSVNRNLDIQRAWFSALTIQDVKTAMENLRLPDQAASIAVDLRQEIDLRIGAAFTRFQTITIQDNFTGIENYVSYGPCQFPTLGFVVDRHLQILKFIREKFWTIEVKYNYQDFSGQNSICKFDWQRNRIYDEVAGSAFYLKTICDENGQPNLKARVLSVIRQPKLKYRPYPMATINLEKIASNKLHYSAAQTMKLAELLYQNGFISYPRTETDKFPTTMNLQDLVNKQSDNPSWGQYAANLLQNNKFQWPKQGKNDDKAHPPIHPVKSAKQTDMSPEEYKIYELVTRHFLACCSKDAEGDETIVNIEIREEQFQSKGLAVRELNYLEVYFPYEKWSNNSIPNFQEGEQFDPTSVMLTSGITQPPPYLSESDLLDLMQKHQIGTDATMHEHIKTIQERGYAIKQGQHFKPTDLGQALVESYLSLGFKLSKPTLRSYMEKKISEVAAGTANRDQVFMEIQDQMLTIFQSVTQQKLAFIQKISQFLGSQLIQLQGNPNQDGQGGMEEELPNAECGKCKGTLLLKQSQFQRNLFCFTCQDTFPMPRQGALETRNDAFKCPLCQYSVITVKSEKGTIYNICPSCNKNSTLGLPLQQTLPNHGSLGQGHGQGLPDHGSLGQGHGQGFPNHGSNLGQPQVNLNSAMGQNLGAAVGGGGQGMPCYKCVNPGCRISAFSESVELYRCPECGKSHQKKSFPGQKQILVGCSGFPQCSSKSYLPSCIKSVFPVLGKECSKCRTQNRKSLLCKVDVTYSNSADESLYQKFLMFQEENIPFEICLYPGCDTELSLQGYQFANQANNAQNRNFTHSFPNNNLMNNQLHNTNSNLNNNQNQNQPNINQNNSFQKKIVTCNICKQEGHYANQCPNKGNPPKNNQNQKQNQKNIPNLNRSNSANNNSNFNPKYTCFNCKQVGHIAPHCPQNNPQVQQNQTIQPPNQTFKQKKQALPCQYCNKLKHSKNDNCQGKKKYNKSKKNNNSFDNNNNDNEEE